MEPYEELGKLLSEAFHKNVWGPRFFPKNTTKPMLTNSTRYNNTRSNYKRRKSTYVPRSLTIRGRNGTFSGVSGPDTNVGVLQNTSMFHAIVKGTDVGDRTGDKIFVKGIRLRGTFYNPNDGTTGGADVGRIRLSVLENKRPGSLQTDNTWISQSADNSPVNYVGTGVAAQMVLQYNPFKFKVYFDKVYPLKMKGTGSNEPKTVIINEYIKINRYFTFNNEVVGDDRVLPDITMLWMVEKDDSGGSFTNPIKTNIVYKINFIDC